MCLLPLSTRPPSRTAPICLVLSAQDSIQHTVVPRQSSLKTDQHLPLAGGYLHCPVFPGGASDYVFQMSAVLRCASPHMGHLSPTEQRTGRTVPALKGGLSCLSPGENGSPWKTLHDFCHLMSITHDKTPKKENTLDGFKLAMVLDCQQRQHGLLSKCCLAGPNVTAEVPGMRN